VVDSKGGVGAPHWEDEPGFSLDAHLERRALEGSGDGALMTVVTRIANEPIDFARSPWKAVLVEGVGRGSALVVRIHHCMGDGFALMDILLSLADRIDGAPDTRQPPQGAVHEEERGLFERAAGAVGNVRDLAEALGHLLLLPFDAKTRFHAKPIGERRLAWSAPIPLALVKSLAHERSATVNDVLMAALAGTYRRYMLERGDEAISFRAIVPVNLRPPGEPVRQDHGNWFGLVFVDLPVATAKADGRLVELKREVDRIKRSKEAIVALGILGALGRSPHVIDHLVQDVFARKASVVVTNVPGPREPLAVAGSRLKDMWFWAPHPAGLGSGASILSYAGNVRVAFRGDVAVLPDPERLATLFADEMRSWADEGRGTRAPGRAGVHGRAP
jgi:WS/DGAT/MGAT family acyltransferase